MRFFGFRLLVSCALLCAAGVSAEEPADSVADAFGFPRGKLSSKDLLASARLDGRKSDADIKAAYLIKSDDNTFSSVRVIVTVKGKIFTPKVEKALKEGFEKPSREDEVKIDVPNVGTIYSALAAMGPGGSTRRAAVKLEAQGLEVAIDETFNSEEPLTVSPETQAYYDALEKDPAFSAKSLAKALETISRDIVAGKYSFAKAVASPVKVEPLPIHPTPLSSKVPPTADMPVTPKPTEPASASKGNPREGFIWALLIAVLLLIVALLRRNRST